MSAIIGCTALEACIVHGRMVGKSHGLRLFNGRVLYDEIAVSRRRYRISRTMEKNGDVLTVDRYINHDTHVELVPYDRPASQPAKSASARLVVDVATLYQNGAKNATATNSKRLSRPVCDASYGGDITLEVGLAESLNLLNSLQLASGGAWLDDAQGQEWRNG